MYSPKCLLLCSLLGASWLVSAAAGADDDKLPHKDALARFGSVRFRNGDGILSLAYSPSGKIIASGGRNEPVHLWDADSGQLIRTLPEHWVWAVAFSPDGQYLATGGANKVVRIYEVESGKEVRQLKGHKATIKAIAYSNDGAALVTAGDDAQVRLWKAADGAEVATYQGHTFGVNAVAIAPDTKSLASGSTDRTVRVWNGKQRTLTAPSGITGVGYLADKKSLITTGDDGIVRVWDIAGEKQVREWKAHTGIITHMVLSLDGKTLATAGSDKLLKVWDVEKGTAVASITRNLGDCDALAMTRDGKQVASGGTNNAIRRWDATTGKPLAAPAAPEGAVTGLACSPDGGLLAAGYSTNVVLLLDPAGKEKHRLVCGPDDGEVLVAFTGDGQGLVTASTPDTVILWNATTGKEVKRFAAPEHDEVRSLACSPVGGKVAVGYTAGGVRVFDLTTGAVHKQIPMPRGARAVAYSRDGKLLAVGTEDAIAIYDANTYQVQRTYPKLNDTVACLAFAPDGRTLAAGMFANNVRLFDLTQPKERTDVEPRTLDGHLGVVNALCWSVNGRCLVTAGFDRTVRLWEFVNGNLIATWSGHAGEATAVVSHPSGRTVVSGSRDTTLLTWDVSCLGQGGKLPAPAPMGQANLDKMWTELAREDNPKANAALWAVVTAADATEYFKKKVFLADPRKIEQCLKDLNSDKFKDREAATATLASYGRWVEGVLKKTFDNPPSEEVRQRVEKLLLRLSTGKDATTLQQERLRMRRIIEILEQTATPEARGLLVEMSQGAAEDDLRDMAQGAVERLKK
jgi:WD40 repeat protein